MQIQIPVKLKRKYSLGSIFDEPVIFHCHHYNTYLQKILLDLQNDEMKSLLTDAATAVAYHQLKELYDFNEAKTIEEKLTLAAGLFKIMGFGLIDFSELMNDHLVIIHHSHYATEWKNKFGQHENHAICFFPAGFIAAAIASARDEELGSYEIVEEQCLAYNSEDTCNFRISSLSSPKAIPVSPKWGTLFEGPITRHFQDIIEEDNIVQVLTKMEIKGDENGLIPTFGLNLTRHYANYYNLISYYATERLSQNNDISRSLIKAGELAGFYTFGGIIKSNEWSGLINPLVVKYEDRIHGLIAWINSLGWGTWDVKEIVIGHGLVLNLYSGYESNGYISMYGNKATTPKCFLATGAATGLMNLLYSSSEPEKLEISDASFNEIFSREDGFHAEETKCRAKGDPHCEIVITRKQL